MSAIPEPVKALAVRDTISKLSLQSFKIFCWHYLRHYFPIEESELQYVLYNLLSHNEVNQRLVVMAPRGSGKSTMICLAFPLWALASQRKKFILIIKESDDRARAAVKQISGELESNQHLQDDFKFLTPMIGRKVKRFVKYASNMVYFANGSIIAAMGKGNAKRGLNEMNLRPDMIIYDDPQGKDEKESPSLRQKDIEAFESEIRFLGGPRASLDIILIGSLIHPECLIQYISQKPGWRTVKIDAVKDEVTKETYWPAVYCYDVTKMADDEIENWSKRGAPGYEKIRTPFYGMVYDPDTNEPLIIGLHEENPAIFDQEFRHRPYRSEAMPLRKDLWKFYPWTPDLHKMMKYKIGALDLSMGKKASDFQAIAIMGLDISNNYYLLDCALTRIDLIKSQSNEEGLANICIAFMKRYELTNFMIEDNGSQGLFVNVLRRLMNEQGVNCILRPFHSSTNKIERISNQLGLIVQNGQLYIRGDYKRHRHYAEFMLQYENFPLGHDDAPDVSNMAVTGIQRLKGRNE